ncbi:xanthine dehydrogenase [Gemmobacter lanyuensis]|uniref:Xanthine dehydrogenase n=1 Tax=Gemmobacter lanyuensis TaxID=1054497 RepID=A0A918IT51_9RHOB|nr:FAD binding domain-containing protein [Gemmobacter lanyuensis]GGW26639.1 xanthine dehydrogenase [Gemmobacter lanyuensis]
MTDYARPHSFAHAFDLMAAGEWRLLAGGTDLYPATSARSLPFAALDISDLPGVTGITRTAAGLRIGAATPWSDLQADLPRALMQAARQVGGWQVQTAGTLGGNLCNASPAADGVPPLLVLEAEVELTGPRGQRRLPVEQFLTGPRQTALAPDEILTAVHLPPRAGDSAFVKLGARAHLVISIAMAAARVRVAAGRLAEVVLAIGACAPTARRLRAIETRLIGLTPTEAARQITPPALAPHVAPLDDIRASAAYRVEAGAEILRRALVEAAG